MKNSLKKIVPNSYIELLRLYQTISLISITSTSIGALIGLDKVIISINGGEKTAKQDSILEILGTASASSMIGMTEGNQGDIIYYKTKNDIEYDIIEERTNKIYDKYHKSHIPSDKRGKGIIIADTSETAVICNEKFNTLVDEYHLVLNIESLLLAVSNILDTKELIPEEKAKLEKAKDLLMELKAAYTEKKIITLSTKDNETLLLILNNFKIRQENKKNNAKKLIKEKKEEI